MNNITLIFILILVSLLWGITNPLLKKYSEGIENIKATSYVSQTFEEIGFLVSRPKYVASFLLNQTGGVLFMCSLAAVDLSLAVPLTNALTFVVTTATGQMLGEEGLGMSGWLGIAMLCTGVGCCIAGKAN